MLLYIYTHIHTYNITFKPESGRAVDIITAFKQMCLVCLLYINPNINFEL